MKCSFLLTNEHTAYDTLDYRNIRTSMNCTEAETTLSTSPSPWSSPKQPWSRMHLDFAGHCLITCTLWWWMLTHTPNGSYVQLGSTSFSTIQQLRTLFTQFGIHRTCCCFRQCSLLHKCRISGLYVQKLKKKQSSPSHALSNGLAGCAVHVFKGLKQKMKLQFLTR